MRRLLIGLMIAALMTPAHANAQAKPTQGTVQPAEGPAVERERAAIQKAEQQRAEQTKAEQERVARLGSSKANIRFDISISDEGGGAPPVRKVVTVVVADHGYASSRSQARLTPDVAKPLGLDFTRGLPLNVDVGAFNFNDFVEIQSDGRIRARLSIEYQPYSPEFKALSGSVQGSSRLLFESGKKVVFVQTADAITDRHTTIEVTATILK